MVGTCNIKSWYSHADAPLVRVSAWRMVTVLRRKLVVQVPCGCSIGQLVGNFVENSIFVSFLVYRTCIIFLSLYEQAVSA